MPKQHRTPESAVDGPSQEAAPAEGAPSMGNAALQDVIAEASKPGGDDDYVRDHVGPAHLAAASARQKVGMIVNLLDGDTGDEDEAKILEILRSSGSYETFRAIEQTGNLEWLFDDVNGEEHEELQQLYSEYAFEKEAETYAADKKEHDAIGPPSPVVPETPAVDPAGPAKADPPVEAAQGPAKEPPITDPDDERLSADRRKMLDLADERMGSYRGEKTTVMTASGPVDMTGPGNVPKRSNGKDGVNLFSGTQWQDPSDKSTSCGLLPGTLFGHMGVKKNDVTKGIVNWGVAGVEVEAKKLGVWVESTGQNAPIPGDVYLLNAADTEQAEHIGVVVRVGPDRWKTADSGQGGDGFAANYVDRDVLKAEEIEKHGYTLPGPYFGPEPGGKGPNRLIGWVDLDALMAKVKGQSPPAASPGQGAGP